MGKYSKDDYLREAKVMVRKLAMWADMLKEAGADAVPVQPPEQPPTIPDPKPSVPPEQPPVIPEDPGTGGGAAWPNEPQGFVQITDQPWDALSSNGWGHLDRGARSDIVTDPTAPHSPPRVLEHVYPKGFTSEGREPAVDWLNLGGPTEIFVGFWWKPSNPWHGHSTGINKVLFCWDQQNRNNIVLTMRGSPGGPYYLEAFPEGHPAAQTMGYLAQNRAKVPVKLGQWQRVELRVAISGGIVLWWVDGALVGDYRGLNLAAGGFGELQIAPTWGGLGGPNKQQQDFFRYDHIHVSRPR